MKLVIISGLSGAGKTVALKQCEDLGYYCIDNLPLTLLGPAITRLASVQGERYQRLAVGIDAREAPTQIKRFPSYLERMRARDVEARLIFLNAADETILRRYGETRRRHPLFDARTCLLESIQLERRLLAPIANHADEVLDTSRMNLHQLREAIHARLPEGRAGKLALLLLSFGFKHGAPDGCDFMFDVRCLPNPHWEPALKKLSGRDAPVAAWLDQQPEAQRMIENINDFLQPWLPRFRDQDRAYVTVGVGCTGGQHRSVYLVEQLAARLAEHFAPVIVKHKELP